MSEETKLPSLPASPAAAPKNPNVPYLIAIVVMSVIGVAGVLAVQWLRPAGDNAALHVAILGFVGPTTFALLAFLKSQETHVLVNSRMDEFKRLISLNAQANEEIARGRGIAEGLRERKET